MQNKTLKGIQKGLTIGSIAGVGVISLMLILWLVIDKVKLFQEDFLQAIFLSIVILTAAFYFASNSLSIIKEKKIIALVSLGLLGLSLLLGLICFWYMWGVPLYDKEVGHLDRHLNEFFGKCTGVIAIFTILFVIIVNSYTKLGKKLLPLQIISYSFVLIIDIILTLAIFGLDILNKIATIFIILCLVTFALLCVVNIIARKHYHNTLTSDEVVDNEEFVKITKTEYDELVRKANEYDKLHKEE